MKSQPGQRIIAIHILHNISRRKGNETIKLGLLIGYNMRNSFPRKYAQNVVENLFPEIFLKN